MKFGKFEIDPAKNPAVLDTATWNPKSAWDIIRSLEERYWQSIQEAIIRKQDLSISGSCSPYIASYARYKGCDFLLTNLADGQQVFIEIGSGDTEFLLGEPIGTKSLSQDGHVSAYKTDAAVIDRYIRFLKPEKGPKALGATHELPVRIWHYRGRTHRKYF
ncbi:MAG: hypothetical protein ACYS80_27800 [Planctomycetota bacterium]|jgi:hypothetical protein